MTLQETSRRGLVELISLDERVAVVTGGGRGIGLAVATRLAEAGAIVTIADVDGELAAAAAAEVQASCGRPCFAQQVDVGDSASVRSLADVAVAESGRLDIWVNAAAIVTTTALVDTPDETWHKTISVDLDGSFFCAREAARKMVAQGRPGVIILFTSLSAHKGREGRSHYVAAKHGVNGLVRSLAVELGPSGIRVVAIAPSVTNTRLMQGDSEGGDIDADLRDKMINRAIEAVPLGRMADPDELATATVFAASDLATFVTGSTLHVDGGASAL